MRENPENSQMATKLFSRRVLMAARSSANLKAASEGCVLTAATSARASEGCRHLSVSQAWQHMKLQTMQTRCLSDAVNGNGNGNGNGGMGHAVVKGDRNNTPSPLHRAAEEKGGEDSFWRRFVLKYWGKFISIAWRSLFLRAWVPILRSCREFANTIWVTTASLFAMLMFEYMTGGISRVLDQFKGNVMGESKGNQSGEIEIKGLNNDEIQSIRIALETVAIEVKKLRDRGDQNLLGRIMAAPKEKTKEEVKVN